MFYVRSKFGGDPESVHSENRDLKPPAKITTPPSFLFNLPKKVGSLWLCSRVIILHTKTIMASREKLL